MTISGATFTIRKTNPDPDGGARVRAQALWLMAHTQGRGLVKVRDFGNDWYEMEYLYAGRGPNGYVPTAWSAVNAILGILERDVWSRAPLYVSVAPAYIGRWPDVAAWWTELGLPDVTTYCDTHGDPTVENLMYRVNGEPVLIDPLPDAVLDGKVPSIRALDLGKILQSGLGYEAIKQNKAYIWNIDKQIFMNVRGACRDDDEWRRACCLCLMHVHRLIPYQPEHLKERWTSWLPSIHDALRSISTGF